MSKENLAFLFGGFAFGLLSTLLGGVDLAGEPLVGGEQQVAADVLRLVLDRLAATSVPRSWRSGRDGTTSSSPLYSLTRPVTRTTAPTFQPAGSTNCSWRGRSGRRSATRRRGEPTRRPRWGDCDS